MIKVALIGNPNVGKSTLFNKLTKSHQHTGNWTGKTVDSASAICKYKDKEIMFNDLPGTYSLIPHSKEEEVTSDYVLKKDYDIAVVVCDSINLSKGLMLVLQTLEVHNNVIVCINMIDELKRKDITLDLQLLENLLNTTVIGVSAINNLGVNKLLECIINNKMSSYAHTYNKKIEDCISVVNSYTHSKFESIKKIIDNDTNIELMHQVNNYLIDENINFSKEIMKDYINRIDNIISKVLKINAPKKNIYDKLLTNKITGIPIMILMLMIIFWISLVGANYPSKLLFYIFNKGYDILYNLFTHLHLSTYFISVILDGVYKVLTWVISVMFPPMAIFFPLFTYLEEVGILPRIAFNLDGYFEKSNTNGKQALTMCMGIGCNCVGVVGSRIIDSKRERLISILTNSFIPCNGRFPTIMAILSIFFSFTNNNIINMSINVLIFTLSILIAVFITLIVSKILSKTILKGENNFFILELSTYKKTKIKNVVITSTIEKTLKVLLRAIVVAIPSGIVIWFLTNFYINNEPIIKIISNILDPVGKIIGLDGVILTGFILGFSANEIVLPIIIMIYLSSNVLIDISDLSLLKDLLIANNWTIYTAINMIIFILFHFPCSTTLLTIYKETKSKKYTILSIVLPLTIGIILCFIVKLKSIL